MTAINRVTLLDNGQTVIRYIRNPRRTSDKLVVTFAEMLVNDLSKPGFGEGFLMKAGYDLIIVQKRSDIWYQDLGLEDFSKAVSSISAGYSKVVCYGASMGAFAALYFGGSVNAAILAVAPLCSIDPRYPEFRVPGHINRVTKHVVATQYDLADAPKADGPVFIVSDPLMKLDALYMRREVLPAFPNATVALAPGAGHPGTVPLNNMGILQPLVLKFIEHGHTSNVAAEMRAVRARSWVWLMSFAEQCVWRRRFTAASWLFSRAIGVAPDPAPVIAKRDALMGQATTTARVALSHRS